VQNDYQRVLHRSADSSGLGRFLAALQQEACDEQIAAAMVGSDEYFGTPT
jgi:hypothetical protein